MADVETPQEAVQPDQYLLIGGWAQSRLALQPLQQAFAVDHQVSLMTLEKPEVDLQRQLASAVMNYSGKTMLVAWSLGGLLALRTICAATSLIDASALQPKLKGIGLIACNPCFVGDDDWPGVGRSLFNQFADDLELDPIKMLDRFTKLQCLGDPQYKQVVRTLMPALAESQQWSLSLLKCSLDWLRKWDCRYLLNQQARITFFFGANDRLIPAQLAGVVEKQFTQSKVIFLQSMAHYPHAQAAAMVARILSEPPEQPEQPESQQEQRELQELQEPQEKHSL